jgi:hypothetical protein
MRKEMLYFSSLASWDTVPWPRKSTQAEFIFHAYNTVNILNVANGSRFLPLTLELSDAQQDALLLHISTLTAYCISSTNETLHTHSCLGLWEYPCTIHIATYVFPFLSFNCNVGPSNIVFPFINYMISTILFCYVHTQ